MASRLATRVAIHTARDHRLSAQAIRLRTAHADFRLGGVADSLPPPLRPRPWAVAWVSGHVHFSSLCSSYYSPLPFLLVLHPMALLFLHFSGFFSVFFPHFVLVFLLLLPSLFGVILVMRVWLGQRLSGVSESFPNAGFKLVCMHL